MRLIREALFFRPGITCMSGLFFLTKVQEEKVALTVNADRNSGVFRQPQKMVDIE